jgi:hypothetical protein
MLESWNEVPAEFVVIYGSTSRILALYVFPHRIHCGQGSASRTLDTKFVEKQVNWLLPGSDGHPAVLA